MEVWHEIFNLSEMRSAVVLLSAHHREKWACFDALWNKKKKHLLGEQTTVSHWYGHWKYFPFKEPVEQKVILTKSWCVIVSHVVHYSTTLDARILYIGWGALLKNSEKVELYNLITQHTENMVRSFQTFQYLIISWK